MKRFGDTAVIIGDLTNHLSEVGGGTRVIEAMVTQVAVREDGTWRFVAFQITPKASDSRITDTASKAGS